MKISKYSHEKQEKLKLKFKIPKAEKDLMKILMAETFIVKQNHQLNDEWHYRHDWKAKTIKSALSNTGTT